MSYEILDHTADMAVRITAADQEALLADAIVLIRQMAVGDSPVQERVRHRLEIADQSDSERFFRFVRELLFLFDVEGFVPQRLVDPESLEVAGEAFDPRRHVPQHQAKALTRHRYSYDRTADGYEVEMVFDL